MPRIEITYQTIAPKRRIALSDRKAVVIEGAEAKRIAELVIQQMAEGNYYNPRVHDFPVRPEEEDTY